MNQPGENRIRSVGDAQGLLDPTRLAVLRRTGLLDSVTEEAFDRLTRLASKMLRVPVALVSLVDDKRQFFKSQVGLPDPWASRRETPLSHSFCKHVVNSREPLVVADARTHPLVKDNLAVAELGVLAYAGIPLTTPEGQTLGAFCAIDGQPREWTADEIDILRDLTGAAITEIQLKLTALEASRQAEAAEQANQAKSRFLANMSHELRTPLNAVIMYSELLMEEAEELGVDGFLSDLETIRNAGRHLLGLINNVLDLSKIEAGKFDLCLERFSILSVVKEVAATIRPLIEKRGNQLQVSCPDGIGFMGSDLTRVRQILFNLLSNASKFTENGTVSLNVHRESTEDSRWVVFQICDTGIGITEKQRDKLFHAFTQADETTTRQYGGTGLGLAITKRLCQMLGGDVDVQSRIGVGSVFTVRLLAAVDDSLLKPPADANARRRGQVPENAETRM